jgi:TonB family protein
MKPTAQLLAYTTLIVLATFLHAPAAAQGIPTGSTNVAGPPDSVFSSFVAFLKKQDASVIRTDAPHHKVEAKVKGSDESIVFVFSRDGDSTAVNAQGTKAGMAAMIVGLGAVNDWIEDRRAHPASSPTPQSSQALADALAQIRAHKLDSATVLLQQIATAPGADSSERAVAYMWLGVASFYSGQDSAARNHFTRALEIDPLLTASGVLARLDSSLAAAWEDEQTRALCGEALPAWIWATAPSETGEPLNSRARGSRPPDIVSGPALNYPEDLRLVGIQGRVVARVIIDSSGHAKPGAIRIISTPNTGFNESVTKYFQKAQFTPRTRSCVVLPVDFKIRR